MAAWVSSRPFPDVAGFIRLVPPIASVSVFCIEGERPRSVREMPARTLVLAGSHGDRAEITSPGVEYRSAGFFASIFVTTSDRPGGNVLSIDARAGASFIWCWR